MKHVLIENVHSLKQFKIGTIDKYLRNARYSPSSIRILMSDNEALSGTVTRPSILKLVQIANNPRNNADENNSCIPIPKYY